MLSCDNYKSLIMYESQSSVNFYCIYDVMLDWSNLINRYLSLSIYFRRSLLVYPQKALNNELKSLTH